MTLFCFKSEVGLQSWRQGKKRYVRWLQGSGTTCESPTFCDTICVFEAENDFPKKEKRNIEHMICILTYITIIYPIYICTSPAQVGRAMVHGHYMGAAYHELRTPPCGMGRCLTGAYITRVHTGLSQHDVWRMMFEA